MNKELLKEQIVDLRDKLRENTVTLGFNKLPIGLPPTKYQRAKLNGFDITDKLSCIDGDIGNRLNQEEEPSLVWLTFKDGLVVVCQKVCIEKIEKGELNKPKARAKKQWEIDNVLAKRIAKLEEK